MAKKFFLSIKRPFEYCYKSQCNTFLWIIFTLFGGLLGVIINLVQRCIFDDMSWSQSIYIDSISGNFYTYALVLISAILGPVFIGMTEEKELSFRRMKVILATICIFAMIMCAVFYSTQSIKNASFSFTLKKVYYIDWWQLIFFILSIILSLYSLGLQYIDKDKENNKDIDDTYGEREDKVKRELEKSDPDKTTDGFKL